jgi:16S rRNA processing protein RimM
LPRTSRIHRPHSKIPYTPPRRTAPKAPQPAKPAPAVDPAAVPSAASRPKPQRAPDDGFIAVGRVLSPFGLKGELRVQILTDNPQRFAAKSRLWAGRQSVTVASARFAQGAVFLTLKGFRDRTSVEPFRHALLQIPEADLPPLAEGQFYRYQLIGLTVVDRQGDVLGTLQEIIETGANDVYRVGRPDGADLLLPALDDVVISIDLTAKLIVVDPPPWR